MAQGHQVVRRAATAKLPRYVVIDKDTRMAKGHYIDTEAAKGHQVVYRASKTMR